MKLPAILLTLLLALTACKKSAEKPVEEPPVDAAYTVHVTIRKMDQVSGESYNHEFAFWLTRKGSEKILKLKDSLIISGSGLPSPVKLTAGSYVTRKIFALAGGANLQAKFTAPEIYWGETIACNAPVAVSPYNLKRIAINGKAFADAGGNKFIPWGVNYTNPDQIPLMDDEWLKPDKWEIIKEDFREMKAMDMNVVRIHLQYRHFMTSPTQPNTVSLKRLQELADFAGIYGLYLDVTGLGCYYKQDTPEWYSSMNEKDRWATQSIFWGAIADALKDRNNIFCYNLMNEPFAPGSKGTDYLPGGELEGYYFLQLISLDPAGRDHITIMRQWITQLKEAIRKKDAKTLVTVGFIGWGNIKPYSDLLDFNSGHTYPKAIPAKMEQNFINNNQTDKPLVIEEIWPLSGSVEVNKQFIVINRHKISGVLSHYFGKTIDHLKGETDEVSVISSDWYKVFTRDINPCYALPQ